MNNIPTLYGDVVYLSTDPAQDAIDYPTHHKILTVPIPSVFNPSLRDKPRKVIAAEIRKLLKALGIKKVSVTTSRLLPTPDFPMVKPVEILLPDYCPRNEHRPADSSNCPVCVMFKAARYRPSVLLVAAFPDLDDRSDDERKHPDWILAVF